MPWQVSECEVGKRKTRLRTVYAKEAWCFHYQLPWPEGKFALHKCDNDRCANPEHIYPGTQRDNMQDRHLRRGPVGSVHIPGEKHRFAKLSDSQVWEVRSRAWAGEKQRVLADEFGVSQSAISRIVNYVRRGGAQGAVALGE